MSTRMLLISVELTKFTMKLAVSALLVSSVAGFNMDMTFSFRCPKNSMVLSMSASSLMVC